MLLTLQLLGLVGLATALPSLVSRHVLHEERAQPSEDWIKGAKLSSDALLPVRIGLAQKNLDNGYSYLQEVSDPSSPSYGQYWDASKVHETFAPDGQAENFVKEWLISSGIDESRIMSYVNNGWLAFDASTEEMERLFLSSIHEYDHRHSSKVRVGSESYHVPEHLARHIDYITPGIKLTPVVKRQVKTKRNWHPSGPYMPKWVPKQHYDWRHDWRGPLSYEPSLPANLQNCDRNMTPPCIRALYGIPANVPAVDGNSLGLYEQGDYFSKEDLDLYYATFAPNVPQGTYPIPALIDGAQLGVPANSSLNTGESDIDIDMAYALIYPQTVTLYQVDDQIYEPEEVATVNLFNTFLDALDGSYCNYTAYGETGNDPTIDPVYPDPAAGGYKGQLQCGVYKPTKVISASYGQAEHDLPLKYSKRQCNEFMKLGLQGHSILTASGDYGVGSFPADMGVERGGTGCLGPQGKIFSPQYPGNCPYITSVGGTMLYSNQTVLDPESVMHVNLGGTAQNFTSAGGFANYYTQPWYQKAAVANYLENHVPDYPYYSGININLNRTTGIYNRIGRGYPDVSANGAYFPAYKNGVLEHYFGASLASPLFASVLTLINEKRALAGKGSVGFVNPTLYAHPWVLNDITNGTNVGCDTNGFHAAPGWDPATGLGTPNYNKMLGLWLSLP